MNLKDADLNLLTAFEARYLDRQGTRAARRLGIGQPAMSDALRRLRLLFGDALFVRAAGAMQPTPKAHALAEELAPLVARLRSVLGAQAGFTPAEASTTFTLASTDYAATVLLPPLMAELGAVAPGINLRVAGYEKDAVAAMLERGEVDLAIGSFADPPPGSVRTPLFRERFVGLARQGHPALPGMDIARFAACSHALVSVRRDARGAVDEVLAAAGLRRRIALVVPYMLSLPPVLAGSDMIATLPERAVRGIGASGLVRFDLPFDIADWSVEMLWNPTSRTDRATAWLRDLVVRVARQV
jgi:DNA-binding transcriptional LysR family regulator